MSDAVDDFYAKRLLRKSATNPMRERMREFVEDHQRDTDLEELRSRFDSGKDLSVIVIENREERL